MHALHLAYLPCTEPRDFVAVAKHSLINMNQEPRNTIGNVPLWWYNDQLHIGYDLEGKKMIRKVFLCCKCP